MYISTIYMCVWMELVERQSVVEKGACAESLLSVVVDSSVQ